MAQIDIAIKLVQLVAALVSLWRNGGRDSILFALEESHKAVCDERCQIERREAQKNL